MLSCNSQLLLNTWSFWFAKSKKKKQASCAKPPSGMCHGRPKFASKILQMLPKGWIEMISETLVVSSRSLVVLWVKKMLKANVLICANGI